MLDGLYLKQMQEVLLECALTEIRLVEARTLGQTKLETYPVGFGLG